MSVFLLSCDELIAEKDKSDMLSSEGTTEGSTTAATSSPDATTTGATTAPTPLVVPEPENPEPIYVGMTEAELLEVEDEMKELSNDTFLYHEYAAFWIDENGNNAVAELKKIDGEWKVASIDRYFPAVATEETFEMIKKMRIAESMNVQKMVELLGTPFRIAQTSGVHAGVCYRDVNMKEYNVSYDGNYGVRSDRPARLGLDNLLTILVTKYSMDSVEVHRVYLEDNGDDDYKICIAGVYGEDKTAWCQKYDINKDSYDWFANYRNTQNGILYNVVVTEEFDYIYYDVREWMFYNLYSMAEAAAK